MRELGRIVRLQVQLAPLKRGGRPDRWYDTSRIQRVASLTVTDHGVVGHTTERPEGIVDVHNRAHPESRFRGDNGISLCTTGHYTQMRERFGRHVTDGIAAENVLIARAGWLDVDDLAGGVRVVPGDARVEDRRPGATPTSGLELHGARPAEPCVEFTRLVAGPGMALKQPLQQLRGGTRGYLLQVQDGAGTLLHEGDLVVASSATAH